MQVHTSVDYSLKEKTSSVLSKFIFCKLDKIRTTRLRVMSSMSQLLTSDGTGVEVKNRIDAKMNEMRKVQNEDLPNAKELQGNLHRKLSTIDDFVISLFNKLELSRGAELTLDSKMETARRSVDKNTNDIAMAKLAMDESQIQRVEKLMLYENQLNEGISKFRDALELYSNVNLKKEIEEIRDQRRIIKDKIAIVDRDVEKLVSKYNLDKINLTAIPGNEAEMRELLQLKAMWIGSNSDKALAMNRVKSSNEELEGKIALSKRKLAKLV